MDFRTELAKWGYNKGNSVDVETLIDEILPSLFSKQERMYSEEDMKKAFKVGFSIGYGSDTYATDEKNKTCEDWFKEIKK